MSFLELLIADYDWYLWIVLFLIGTGCGLPLPEEFAIIPAGVAASAGKLDPWIALIACIVGALAGDVVMYGIGRVLGVGWLRRHPRLAKWLHVEHEKKMEQLIRRHGLKVFFIARFTVGIRGPFYLANGIMRIPFVLFFVRDLICATVVVSIFFGASYYFGDQVTEWIRKGEWAITVVVLIAVLIVGTVLVVRGQKLARKQLAEMEAADRAAEAKPANIVGECDADPAPHP